VAENDISVLGDATLGEAEVDVDGELVAETEPLSRFVTDDEAVAKEENSVLCESKELEESEAEDEIEPSCETELLRDGMSIVFEDFTDAETVLVPANLFVGERKELKDIDRDASAVFVNITEVDSIGELETLALNESKGEADVDTLCELLPDVELEPDKDPDDETELESE
jgi:hypothetical protein